MKKKRKLLALLLAVCVTVQLIPSSAFAAEGKVRDTNFFTPQYHGDVDFEDMEYQPFDLEGFRKKADSLCLLAKNAANADVVRQGVEELGSLYEKGCDMRNLANIQFDQNVMDEGASLRKQEMQSVLNNVGDCFFSVPERDSAVAMCLQPGFASDRNRTYRTAELQCDDRRTAYADGKGICTGQ